MRCRASAFLLGGGELDAHGNGLIRFNGYRVIATVYSIEREVQYGTSGHGHV